MSNNRLVAHFGSKEDLQMAIGLTVLPASALFGLAYNRWGAHAAFGAGAGLALLAAAIVPSQPNPRR